MFLALAHTEINVLGVKRWISTQKRIIKMDDPQTLKTQQKTQTSLFPDFFVKQSHMWAYLFFILRR